MREKFSLNFSTEITLQVPQNSVHRIRKNSQKTSNITLTSLNKKMGIYLFKHCQRVRRVINMLSSERDPTRI